MVNYYEDIRKDIKVKVFKDPVPIQEEFFEHLVTDTVGAEGLKLKVVFYIGVTSGTFSKAQFSFNYTEPRVVSVSLYESTQEYGFTRDEIIYAKEEYKEWSRSGKDLINNFSILLSLLDVTEIDKGKKYWFGYSLKEHLILTPLQLSLKRELGL